MIRYTTAPPLIDYSVFIQKKEPSVMNMTKDPPLLYTKV